MRWGGRAWWVARETQTQAVLPAWRDKGDIHKSQNSESMQLACDAPAPVDWRHKMFMAVVCLSVPCLTYVVKLMAYSRLKIGGK